MKIEKAKEVLKKHIENVKDDYIISDYCENCGNIQAIETVLQALDRNENTEDIEVTDTNVGNIEKDIERCKELIKDKHKEWIGITNQKAIENLLNAYERLQNKLLDIIEGTKVIEKETPEYIEESINNLKTLLFQDNLTQNGKQKLIEYYENKIKELDIDLTTVYIKGVEDEKSKIKNKIKELKKLIDKIQNDEKHGHEIPLYQHDIEILEELLKEENKI